jgi:ABC-type uncharacterized transport system substrate-binding protein
MIASYARPGGNVTGILSQVEGLPGKQVEIAREVVPGLTVLGVLVNPANATHAFQRQEIEAAAMSSGIKIVAVEARSKADLEPAFKALHAAGVRAGGRPAGFLVRQRISQHSGIGKDPETRDHRQSKHIC